MQLEWLTVLHMSLMFEQKMTESAIPIPAPCSILPTDVNKKQDFPFFTLL